MENTRYIIARPGDKPFTTANDGITAVRKHRQAEGMGLIGARIFRVEDNKDETDYLCHCYKHCK